MKRVVVPFALAAALAAPFANATTWQFEYSGLNDPNSSFPPIITSAGGTFSAVDADNNGVIALNEVSDLKFFGWQVLPVVETWNPAGFITSTQLSSFSYTVGSNALSFAAAAGDWQEAYSVSSNTLFWSNGLGNFSYDLAGPGVSLNVALDGTSAIAAAPVPEPETYGLMLIGLAALGLARRRLQARSRA